MTTRITTIHRSPSVGFVQFIPNKYPFNSTPFDHFLALDSCDLFSLVCSLSLLLQDGSRGHLEGLASVYCEMLMAPFADVIDVLEGERVRAWSECSPKRNGMKRGHQGSPGQGGLPNSHSQPIYVPGKYSPSSCLSDKEEDEIYGFGYGVFAQQVARRPLQSANNSPQHQNANASPYGNSAPQYYANLTTFENAEMKKKKMTLGRLLKGFKTVKRKDKGDGAGVGGGSKGTAGIPDRLRQQFHLNGRTQLSFEETIQRLKMEEAMRKREKYQREHEEVG